MNYDNIGEFILNKLQKLNISNIDSEDVEFSLLKVKSYILNYCNICNLSNNMIYVYYDMTLNLLIRQSNELNNSTSAVAERATSIKEGDTTINLSYVKSVNNVIHSNVDFFDNYNIQLNEFRRLKWK
jgi:hypothetical protein